MARLFIGLALATLSSASPATAAQTEQEIVGYSYACSSKVAMPHPIGDLEGDLVINEDGSRDSFFAKVYGMKSDADPLFWATGKELRRRGIREKARWSMTWRGYGGGAPMSYGEGYFELDVSTQRKLELENLLVLSRSDSGPERLEARGRRWPGRKSGAGFGFELSKLLAFAGDSDMLTYRLYSGSTPSDWKPSRRRLRAAGRFDLGPPRSVAAAFARLRAELTVKAGDYRKACERRPVYYNPGADI